MLNYRLAHTEDSALLTTTLLPDLRAQLTNLHPQNHSTDEFEALLTRVLDIGQSKRGIIRIGMYDGSFDPPHYGHVETMRAAVQVARLDLVVLNCHPKPSTMKPNLSPHPVRTEMLSSYFQGDPLAIVSPLSRAEIEATLAPHRIIGIIGSDAFNRFLSQGIAEDFNTDEIFVSERRDHPLPTAPVSLEGRRVWYIGRSQLAQNDTCSTAIRETLAASNQGPHHPMINASTAQLARTNSLYSPPKNPSSCIPVSTQHTSSMPDFTVPEMYKGHQIIQRIGLENGLLSESYICEVRSQAGDTVAYMKTLPPHRDPHNMLKDEASGLAFCNQLMIPGVSSPEAHFCSEPPSLWVTKAPGETVGSLITKYDRGLVSDGDVYRALNAVGAFLKELHTRHRQPFDTKAQDLLEIYIEHHEKVLECGDPLELQDRAVQEAVEIFRAESQYLRTAGLYCALLHGDANCGNFLWDIDSKHLSVIDLQRLGTQLRKDDRGFAAFECRSLLNVLGYYPNIGFQGVRGGLEKAEAAFRAGYGEINQHEDRFFSSIRFIRRALAGNERVHQITRPAAPI